MECLLGIDVGTTGIKAGLFTAEGEMVDLEYRSYPISYLQPGWVEQNPEDWWENLVLAVRRISERNSDTRRVLGISLSTQGGCTTLLDENFRPLQPSISWLDTRASEVADDLRTLVGEQKLYETSGWANFDRLTFPVLFWFRKMRPDILDRASYIASTIDYLNYRLSGHFAVDVTNAAMTQLMDLHRRRWWGDALSLVGMSETQFAEIVSPGRVLGTLTREAAEALGLPSGVQVVAGMHDQYSASLGAGSIQIGDCVLSSGTAWVLLLTWQGMVFEPSRKLHPGIHVLPDKAGLLTTTPFGGGNLEWFRDAFAMDANLAELSLTAAKAPRGSQGVFFMPHGVTRSGRAAFLGMDSSHRIEHIVRAIFEGVAYSVKQNFEIFQRNGLAVKRVVMIGGGAKSEIWPEITAEILGVQLSLPSVREAACTGTGILSSVSIGLFENVEEAVQHFVGPTVSMSPRLDNVEFYQREYGRFVEYLQSV